MLDMQNSKFDIDNAWESFLENNNEVNDITINKPINSMSIDKIPKGSEIYISTKTKIAYLSHPIDLFKTFWKININPYHIPKNGIIKKQMKFNFTDEKSLYEVQEKLKDYKNVEEHIITTIINPEGRIKFKDIRKISIGLCNKDITSYRSKKKSAFYNCFVVILRICSDNNFKEVHIKVFNTGKLEIPGIRCDILFNKIIDLLINILKSKAEIPDLFYNNNCETVLINSNFNCGFYINREKLFNLLKYKYQINSIFDACSYPGIQCKYYYVDDSSKEYKISFMIFRTGSVLIVGKCDEYVLHKIHKIIKELLITEYDNIYVKNNEQKAITKKKKLKKKPITIN